MLNKDLTLENRCELNRIRNAIEKMPALTESEKRCALSTILCAVLDLYDAESTMGVARYELELHERLNKGRLYDW